MEDYADVCSKVFALYEENDIAYLLAAGDCSITWTVQFSNDNHVTRHVPVTRALLTCSHITVMMPQVLMVVD